MYTSITEINFKQIMLRTTIISLALMIGALLFTQSAHAQGKPESPGKSEEAKTKSYSDDSEEGEEAEDESEEEDEDGDDSKGKSKDAPGHNKSDEMHTMTLRAQEAIARNLERGVGSEQRMLTLSRVLDQLVEIYNRLNNIEDDGGDDGDVAPANIISAWPLDSEATLNVVDGGPDYGEYSFTIELTASGTDVTIPEDAVTYNILSIPSSTVVTTGTTSAVLSSDASTSTDGFVIAEGETESFTLTVTFEPEESGAYSLQLDSVLYDGGELELTPAEDYRTSTLLINVD